MHVVVRMSECTCRVLRSSFVVVNKPTTCAMATAGHGLVHITPSSWENLPHLFVGIVRGSVCHITICGRETAFHWQLFVLQQDKLILGKCTTCMSTGSVIGTSTLCTHCQMGFWCKIAAFGDWVMFINSSKITSHGKKACRTRLDFALG